MAFKRFAGVVVVGARVDLSEAVSARLSTRDGAWWVIASLSAWGLAGVAFQLGAYILLARYLDRARN